MPESIIVQDFRRQILQAGIFEYRLEFNLASCPLSCFDTMFDGDQRLQKNIEIEDLYDFLTRNGIPEKGLEFSPDTIKVRGKEMGILLDARRSLWMTIHFELHGHPVLMRTWELEAFINGTHPARIRNKKDEIWKKFPLPAIALHGEQKSIGFYDHNRLIRVSFRLG